MRRSVLVAVFVVAILGSLATVGVAQNGRQFLIAGGVGYASLSDLTNEKINGVTRNSENPTPDGSLAFGGGVYYMAMPELAVGAEASWLDFGEQTVDGADDSYGAIPITAQAIYMIPNSSMATPFATGGLGLYHLMNEEKGQNTVESTSNVLGFNVGGGVKIDTSLPVGFGVDVRFHMAMNPELKGDTPSGERTIETSDWKMLTVMGKVFF